MKLAWNQIHKVPLAAGEGYLIGAVEPLDTCKGCCSSSQGLGDKGDGKGARPQGDGKGVDLAGFEYWWMAKAGISDPSVQKQSTPPHLEESSSFY